MHIESAYAALFLRYTGVLSRFRWCSNKSYLMASSLVMDDMTELDLVGGVGHSSFIVDITPSRPTHKGTVIYVVFFFFDNIC